MKPIKFNETSDYQRMEVLGIDGVFTNLRIDENTLPEGFYKYSLRHGDDGDFCSISKNITVNHAGDFITKNPIPQVEKEECDIGLDDWGFTEDEYDKEFDFESYFGYKLSLDCQIDNANAKKEAQMGGNTKEKQPVHDDPEKEELL